MVLKIKKWNLFFFISLACFLLSACAGGSPPRHWPEKYGRVLEYGTNKPLNNVIVIAHWQGTGGAMHAQTNCFHIETATTNENGEFKLPSYYEGFGDSLLNHRHVLLYFYKAGYEDANNIYGPYYKHKNHYLNMFKGSNSTRVKYFSGKSFDCGNKKRDKALLLPLYKSIYKELNKIARSEDERKTLSSYQYLIDEQELGWEKAQEILMNGKYHQ
jgi:hypothetical protein